MADNNKDVNFRIRATDESAKGFKAAKKNIDSVTSSLTSQAKAAEAAASAAAEHYSATNKTLDTVQAKAFEARKAFDAFATSLAGAKDPTRSQVREFEKLGGAADRADKDVLKLQDRLKTAEAGFNSKFSLFESIIGSDADRIKAERASLGFATSLEQAEAAQQRLIRLNAFRKIGDDAEASAVRLRTFGSAASGIGAATSNIAGSLKSIIDPAGSARATLEGLETELTRVVAVIGNADKPVRNYQSALIDLGRIQSDLVRQGSAVDAYKEQQVAIEGATAAFRNAQDDVLRYAQAIRTADAPNEALAANLRQAEAALHSTSQELDLQQAKLLRLKTPLDAAKISVDGLATAETRLKTAATGTAAASEKLGKAFAGTNNSAGRFLGLKPYELQNLGFQVNDVFTQIASGTSIMQTFAQQGGQIVQIFPQLLTGALRFLPVIGVLGPPILVVALAFARLYDLKGAANEFSGALALNSDGLNYNAQALADSAVSLGDYGIKLDDAKKAIQSFVNVGADPKSLIDLTRTAQNLADALGIKLPDAVSKVRDAFFGSFESVQKLDQELNFLNATESEHIRALFESGDAEGARTAAYEIFKKSAQDGADKANGEWKDATRNFGSAWNNFLDIISNSAPITDAIKNVTNLLEIAGRGFAALNRLTQAGNAARASIEAERAKHPLPVAPSLLGQVGKGLGFLATEFNKPRANRAGAPRAPRVAAPVVTPAEKKAGIDLLANTQRQDKAVALLADKYKKVAEASKVATDQEKLSLVAQKARSEAQAAGLDNTRTAQVVALAISIKQREIDSDNAKAKERADRKGEAASRKAASAAKRLQNEAETALRKRESLESQITNSLASLSAKAGRTQEDNLQAQTDAVESEYAKMGNAIDEFQKKYGASATINGQSLGAVRSQLEANKELIKQQVTQQFYSRGLKDLEGQRADQFERIADAQDAGRLSSSQAFAEAQKQQDLLGPKIAAMAQDAIDWATAINDAKPSPALQAFIAQQEKTRDNATRTGAKSDLGQLGATLLSRDQAALNATLVDRNELISATNELYRAGLKTGPEAEAAIKAAIDSTSGSIETQSQAVLDLATKLHDTGFIGDQAFAAISAKLNLIAVSAKAIETPVTAVRQQLEQMFTAGALNVFDTAAQSLAGLVDGTLSFGDAIRSISATFLQFAADFLRQIAIMIIQQAIFNALKTAASSSDGGIFSSLARAVVGTRHMGGIAGDRSNVTRRIDPSIFLNAPRYHSGTLGVGLNADEQAAILQKNEEVLTTDNPRHIKNWKGNGSSTPQSPQDIKVVNVSRPADVLSAAMADRRGQRVILNFLRDNPGAVGSTRGGNG